MRPKLIALTVIFMLGIAAAIGGTSGAQDSTTETGGSTEVTTAPTPSLPPQADMPFEQFKKQRLGLRGDTVRIHYRRCLTTVHEFRHAHWQIKPWLRADNLSYWRVKKDKALDRQSKCRLIRGTPAQAIRLGKIMAARAGITGSQWGCLYELFGPKESSWRWWADNPTSSAYGIPQALPGSKMTPGSDDWVTHTWKQIRWGIAYVKGRYRTACNALSFRIANGWY